MSDNLEITTKLVKIKTNGIITFCIIFPTKLTVNRINGSANPLVVILPVASIKVIRSGTSIFINPTKLFEVS